jgi:hypothetical protein
MRQNLRRSEVFWQARLSGTKFRKMDEKIAASRQLPINCAECWGAAIMDPVISFWIDFARKIILNANRKIPGKVLAELFLQASEIVAGEKLACKRR